MPAPCRSLLFVPGDSERKISKARASGADGLVLDLEDSVAPGRKDVAREIVARLLCGTRPDSYPSLWVRINSLATPEALADLAAIVEGRPAGVLLPKADGPHDLVRLGHYLDALEAKAGFQIGTTSILPVATETASAPFGLGAYKDFALPRLFGMTWGAEDLSAALGATTKMDDGGQLSLTYRTVRSLCLLAAKACGVEALDTVYPDFKDLEGLRRACIVSHREGFTGCFAIHPDQVAVINEAYTPSVTEIEFAAKVVAAFAAAPAAGTLAINGKMLDRPHLVQAQKLLARHASLRACEPRLEVVSMAPLTVIGTPTLGW